MATESRAISPDLSNSEFAEKLREEPFRFDFFQAVYLLERLSSWRKSVGRFAHPSTEVSHFRANPSLAFPASQVQELECPQDRPAEMTVNFMGLTGPEGALPNAYTTLIIERLRSSDTSLRDFLDIFNHRIISLFYGAWKKHRFRLSTSEDVERFSRELLSLVGLGTPGLQSRESVPDEAFTYYAGLLGPKTRSVQAFRQILGDFFDIPVEIDQFSGGWYRLHADSQCCLDDRAAENQELGIGAVVGDAVWDQQARVCIVLGPLSLDRYSDFLPSGRDWPALISWARFFSNEQLDIDVKLVLEREQVPPCSLGSYEAAGPQLGWVSWVNSAPFQRNPDDTVLTLIRTEGRT